MAIKWGPDLGAPVAVTAVDLILEATAPDYTKIATGVMAVGGYLGAFFNFGGDFVKNVGIASLPAFAKNVYDWAMAGAGTTAGKATRQLRFQRSSVSRSSVSRYPAPASSAPFTGVKLI